jgi:DNA replication protein DnaC
MSKVQYLQSHLKKLNLTGMVDTLDIRVDQAQQEHLGYLDFLEFLLQDELERRSQRGLERRIKQAYFEEVKTLSDFDFTYNPQIPAQRIRDLATCHFVEQKASILICGPVGVGKTFVAQAIGYQACVQGYRVRFIKTNRLLADLGGGHAEGAFEARLKAHLRPDVLILDDFCLTAFTEQQSEDLYRLVDERMRRSPVIATSNRSPEHWYELFPNPVLGEAILDRLINCSHVLTLTGRSYRPRLRPGKTQPENKEVDGM